MQFDFKHNFVRLRRRISDTARTRVWIGDDAGRPGTVTHMNGTVHTGGLRCLQRAQMSGFFTTYPVCGSCFTFPAQKAGSPLSHV